MKEAWFLNNASEDPGVHMDGSVFTTEGEFAGWRTYPHAIFEFASGPFYFRDEMGRRTRCAFRVEKQHLNAMGSADGGCLMAFAKFSLFAFASGALGAAPTAIVSFYAEFLDPANEGDFIESDGGVVATGHSLIFIKGILRCKELPLLTYSGLIKRAVKAK